MSGARGPSFASVVCAEERVPPAETISVVETPKYCQRLFFLERIAHVAAEAGTFVFFVNFDRDGTGGRDN